MDKEQQSKGAEMQTYRGTISDCWIEPGSQDNGNILWVSTEVGDYIIGGYRSVQEAQHQGRLLGWEPTIEEA